jgi:hypothetical protein
MRAKKSDLLAAIRDKKDIKADDIEGRIKAALQEFVGLFQA